MHKIYIFKKFVTFLGRSNKIPYLKCIFNVIVMYLYQHFYRWWYIILLYYYTIFKICLNVYKTLKICGTNYAFIQAIKLDINFMHVSDLYQAYIFL